MDTKFAGSVRSRRNNAALIPLASHDNRLAFQRGIEEFLDRDEERVHINVEDGLGRSDISRPG